MTITEAVRETLRRKGRPMTIDEIYAEIVAEGLASFKSSQPRAVSGR